MTGHNLPCAIKFDPGHGSRMSISSFRSFQAKYMGQSLAFREDNHQTQSGRVGRGARRREVWLLPHPKVNGRHSLICIFRIPRRDATTTFWGEAVSHPLPNTDRFSTPLDILKAVISLCVTLCCLLTAILVTKLTILA